MYNIRPLLLWFLFVNPLLMAGLSAQASVPGSRIFANYPGQQASFIDHLLTARVAIGNERA